MALQCYIDESADGIGSHTAVMAGYLAKRDTWLNFNNDWDVVLNKQKKSHFHRLNRIFSGSGSTTNAEEFYRVIEKHLNHAFCVTANISSYRNLIKRIKFPESLHNSKEFKKLCDPFFLMYQALIELSIYEKERLGLTEPIDFIFDDTKKFKDIISSAFEYTYYSAQKVGISQESLGAFPLFQDDKTTKPLQAANLLAGLIRKTTSEGIPWDGSQMPWERRKSIKCLIVDLEENYFLYRFDNAFSENNVKIYDSYNKLRDYS